MYEAIYFMVKFPAHAGGGSETDVWAAADGRPRVRAGLILVVAGVFGVLGLLLAWDPALAVL
jgi:hypothetical protein